MTHPHQDRLVRELIAQDSSLRGRETEVRQIVEALLKNDPAETPTAAFLTGLREELRARALQMEMPWWQRWQGWLPVAFASSAAVTAILVLFLPGVRHSLWQSPEPSVMDTAMPVSDQESTMVAPYGTPANSDPPADAARNMQAPLPETGNDAAGTEAAPMMMQMAPARKSMTQPALILPRTLAIPTNLSGTASMHDPSRGDREITVYAPTLEMIRETLISEITGHLPADSTVTAIRLGNPQEVTRSYAFESLPGPVTVRMWIFSEVWIDGKAWAEAKTNPVIVPLQLPTYE